MKNKKKRKDNNIKKYAMTSNHKFSINISRILDELGKTSKNTFNHYMFCYKFYMFYKELVYEEVFLNILKNNKFNKDYIDDLIKITFNKYYQLYQNDFKIYTSNNNIIYNYIKSLNLNIDHINFMKIYNELITCCIGLTNLNTSTSNLLFLYEKNIYNILNSFYRYKYFNVKDGLINKKPIKIKFNEIFKTHVMTTEQPTKFIVKTDYKNIINGYLNKDIIDKKKQIKLLSENSYLFNLVYGNIKFEKTYSNIIVQTIKKAESTISSYYALKDKGLKANKPKYIKEDYYSIIFCINDIKHEDKNINKKQLRILFGNYITKNWNKFFNENLLVKPILKIRKPTLLKNENIKLKQIEIKKVANRIYKVCYIVDKPKPEEIDTTNVKLKDVISIDLGLKNLFTIHDPNGKQLILKGGYLTSLNEYYKKRISNVQSKKDLESNKQKKEILNNEIKILNDARLRKLNGKMNNIINKLKELYPTKKLIVIGYNEGWKTNINLGSKTNKKFYDVPYARLLKKLKYAFDGKANIEEINEAYTSKCDALGNEDIEKHEVYKGNRMKRGLFSSSVNKLINADLNGAINILRKFTNNEYKKIKGLNLFNPEKITL